MPIFTLAYGSFGDITLCVQLLWKIGRELRDTTGSSQEYQALKAELTYTVSLLDQVRRLEQGPQTSKRTQDLLQLLREEVALSHQAIQNFMTQHRRPRGILQIVTWHTMGTNEARELQELLSRRCMRLSMLLDMFHQSSQKDRNTYESSRVTLMHREGVRILSTRIESATTGIVADVASVGQHVIETQTTVCKIKEILDSLGKHVKDMSRVEIKIAVVDPLNRRHDLSLGYCQSYQMAVDMIKFLARHNQIADRMAWSRRHHGLRLLKLDYPLRFVSSVNVGIAFAAQLVVMKVRSVLQRILKLESGRTMCHRKFQVLEMHDVDLPNRILNSSVDASWNWEEVSQFRLLAVVSDAYPHPTARFPIWNTDQLIGFKEFLEEDESFLFPDTPSDETECEMFVVESELSACIDPLVLLDMERLLDILTHLFVIDEA
ncbi:hypothetical protein PIIN_04344 [Serendipita indica DSM 11827]|uniref:Fungal N-terminal domain-containing protein n=1 Tax=Serendipita indica (strain DSM 11827) TaxID=1109443 RepID=G4TGG2_SERID|nr:hypothetical protein PIIN_04344 [Serendipita indica DSM 11827]